VQRAASTGGGRTYRGQRPVNWYASLVVICVLGLLSIVWARYQYQNPGGAAAKVQPTVGTTWYSAIGFDICGRQAPALPASAHNPKQGMTTDGSGVLVISPKSTAQSGNNAVLGQFVSVYPGLILTSTKLGYPKVPVFHNGEKCPKGTPDVGQVGQVRVAYWSSYSNKLKDYEAVKNPNTLKPANQSEITMNFLPKDAPILKPPSSAILAMVKAFAAPTTTTTAPVVSPTAPTTTPTTGVTSTTAPVSTSTTSHSSNTVPPTTATTVAKATTTTTKK
jgi:hypothetical protein